jgi:small subunit ribosomal protein S1
MEKTQARDPWYGADKRLARGSKHKATVSNAVEYGCFVELDDGLIGLVHKSKLGGVRADAGDEVEVEILWVEAVKRKIGLRLVRVLQEEAGDLVTGVPATQHGLPF